MVRKCHVYGQMSCHMYVLVDVLLCWGGGGLGGGERAFFNVYKYLAPTNM